MLLEKVGHLSVIMSDFIPHLIELSIAPESYFSKYSKDNQYIIFSRFMLIKYNIGYVITPYVRICMIYDCYGPKSLFSEQNNKKDMLTGDAYESLIIKTMEYFQENPF